MRFSEFWLREWVKVDINSHSLSEQLTMSGLEVKQIRKVAGNSVGVVVGEIVECKPFLQKSYVTKVNIDQDSNKLITIVCDAENCRKGIKVAVAVIGALLLDKLRINARNIHNILSQGKLCSFSNLGIFELEKNNHIIELPSTAPIGMDIRNYLQLDDKILEINVTPNRADCLSIRGIARDIAVLNNSIFHEKEFLPVPVKLNDSLSIEVKVPEACPRYIARILKEVDVNVPTPLWMSEKLRRCNYSFGNVVVDIINYILLELGQPINVFDFNSINGNLTVRMAKPDETFILTKSNHIHLQEDILVVADSKKVLSIAGIVRGISSDINQQTNNILIESAFFHPLFIRGRSLRYGLHTEVSQRYERGVDPMIQFHALELATDLFIQICGGKAGPIIDVTNITFLPKGKIIQLRRTKLDSLIGQHIADDEIDDILSRLSCDYTLSKENDSWNVKIPSWRFDLNIQEDLIEEIARIYGYNKISCRSFKTYMRLNTSRRSSANISLKRVRTLLVDRGYQEVITYSFVNPEIQRLLHPEEEYLKLSNPISTELSAMRISLWSGLLSVLIYNQNRQQKGMRLFEIGRRFIPRQKKNHHIEIAQEDLMLTGIISGNRYEDHWDSSYTYKKSQQMDFYDLKGDVEALLNLTGKKEEILFQAETDGNAANLHPGQSAGIYLHDERIGVIGVIHPELQKRLNLNDKTIIFELLWNKIYHSSRPVIRNISRVPSNRRDIAIVVAEDIPASDIIAECKNILLNKLVGITLFDVYRGKSIAKGYKSLAISLILQDSNRTLQEYEIAALIDKCVDKLKSRFKASLRNQ
ncbi:MAG: phenylalanine--tRNA ligase subunit beta [Candidatus Dasytiphilus stammeri]